MISLTDCPVTDYIKSYCMMAAYVWQNVPIILNKKSLSGDFFRVVHAKLSVTQDSSQLCLAQDINTASLLNGSGL